MLLLRTGTVVGLLSCGYEGTQALLGDVAKSGRIIQGLASRGVRQAAIPGMSVTSGFFIAGVPVCYPF